MNVKLRLPPSWKTAPPPDSLRARAPPAVESVHPALRKSVLVAAEHHGVRVAPKIERRFAVAHPIEERGFYRLIYKHVVARASGEQQSPDRHDNSI